MQMENRGARRGFSLIELLVVIAIIAIIAGFTFPLMATQRERGNQTACIGNLQNIGQALKLYRLDERAYPPALYGYVDMSLPSNMGKSPTDPEITPTTFLYPHYMRARRDFKCPDNQLSSDELALSTPFTGSTGYTAVPNYLVRGNDGTITVKPITDGPVYYYVFDSYDGALLQPVLPRVKRFFELHYRPDWASLFFGVTSAGDPRFARSMLNRNPEDSTYVTMCPYHRQYDTSQPAAGGIIYPFQPGARSLDMVLFLDGHTEKVPSNQDTGFYLQPGSPLQPK